MKEPREFKVDVGDSTGERTRPPEQGAVPNSGQHRESSVSGGAENNGQRTVRHDKNFTSSNPGPFEVGQQRGAGQDPPKR